MINVFIKLIKLNTDISKYKILNLKIKASSKIFFF